ncbi:MAG: FHA domain-containing protein [Anaerolineae bacterium]|jgi:pSer/pThr/pTyr-binding forkhead associated (FHA) protein|nr:FHA domain-containing protein [Anaerolineae bacterium]
MPEERRRFATRHFRQSETPLLPEDQLLPPPEPALPVRLRFVREDMIAVLDVAVRNFLIVGRKDNNDDRQVDIDFAAFDGQKLGVSRHHAIIQVQQNEVHIKDYNSSNGTFLNDFRLKPMFNYRLRHGDALALGRLKLTVHFMPR